ncbi:ROK family transcriptional regulator [soil metagenome]
MQNEYRGLRSTAVRPHNRRLVLQLLRASGPLTRPAISTASGLSPAAVSNVVNELIDDGFVADQPAPVQSAGLVPRRVGRPATAVRLVAESKCVLALQVGAGTFQVGVCDIEANLLDSRAERFAVRRPADEVLGEAADALADVLRATGRSPADVLGIGVGAAGLVDRTGRHNIVAANSGWRDVPMADLLEAHLDMPVTVDHNVRAMATGEARYGRGVDVESLVFIYARTGLGLGLVLDGRPYRSGRLGSHEIGHLPIVGADQPCSCGKRGCLETVVSDIALFEQLRIAGLAGADRLDAHVLATWVAAVHDGEPDAVAVRDRFTEALGQGLAVVVELLDPHVIIVGGLLDDCRDILIEPLRRSTAERLTSWTREGLRIEPTAFGPSSGLIGAATVALDAYLFGAPLREPVVRRTFDASALATVGNGGAT